MTCYQKQYEASLETYKRMKEEYDVLVENPVYNEITATMPFEFLNARHLCQNLALYAKSAQKPRMFFTNAQEAVVFYQNLIRFKKKTCELLESAAYLNEVGEKAASINRFVSDNVFLGKNFQIAYDEDLVKLAKNCLEEIPEYPALMTKEFRFHFIESLIACLPKEELAHLVEAKVILTKDLDKINLIGDSEYADKIVFLCDILHRPAPMMASYDLDLKGVTFNNEDGTSRQETLAKLQKYTEQHPEETVRLQAEAYTFVPEIGDPEPAIRILWDGQCIGNLAKDVARDIHEKFENPQMTASLIAVKGGNKGLNYGCSIIFGIVSPAYHEITQQKETEREER